MKVIKNVLRSMVCWTTLFSTAIAKLYCFVQRPCYRQVFAWNK